MKHLGSAMGIPKGCKIYLQVQAWRFWVVSLRPSIGMITWHKECNVCYCDILVLFLVFFFSVPSFVVLFLLVQQTDNTASSLSIREDSLIFEMNSVLSKHLVQYWGYWRSSKSLHEWDSQLYYSICNWKKSVYISGATGQPHESSNLVWHLLLSTRISLAEELKHVKVKLSLGSTLFLHPLLHSWCFVGRA